MVSFTISPRTKPRSKACGLRRGGWDAPFQITVHDREEDLEEEVDGVDQHRQQVKPRFAGHDENDV